jgi:phosphatidylserine/phosphatidylglycerophosphate/cardiolipin synthase-like enzyme/uncharacterized membrane protein YdjX (TVP38/TMEM64 family)
MAVDILRPNRNVWRVERASRAAVLLDAAEFFGAVREAFLKARRGIYVIGWDIDSRVRLVGNGCDPDDGFSANFSELVTELVQSRPDLRVHLLLWSYSLLYAAECELSPRLSLQWKTPDRVVLCLDDCAPFGSSQHQKVIVIDDAVAFCGGCDVTIRRWDTSEHCSCHPGRVDPAGKPYDPFHDVQMVVDGPAARALAALARRRWQAATGEQLPSIEAGGDPWPESITPAFSESDIGIARTQPRCGHRPGVREVEALFVDSIAAAERSIYIENQFAISRKVAALLARQLRRRKKLELVVVTPRSYGSWIESQVMGAARARFLRMLREAGGDRVRIVYPATGEGDDQVDTMVHSKVMIVDDKLLRVGSANLNSRSMAVDSECDLALEARTPQQRAAIQSVRNRLLADHCGVDASHVAETLERSPSLLSAVDTLAGGGRRLRPIEPDRSEPGALGDYLEEVGDPKRPLRLSWLWRKLASWLGAPGGGLSTWMLALPTAIVLALAWSFTPLSSLADPGRVESMLHGSAQQPWAILLVTAVFVVGGLLVFPVTVLIIATAAAFGPWLGFLYAMAGALASAVVTYWIGAAFGQEALSRVLGPRLARIRARIARRGVLAVAAVRLLPLAPFSLVNLVAGASAIRLPDYLAGTLLGMAPGLVLLSALGDQIVRIVVAPSLLNVVLLLLAASAWIGLSFLVQALLSKRWSESS